MVAPWETAVMPPILRARISSQPKTVSSMCSLLSAMSLATDARCSGVQMFGGRLTSVRARFTASPWAAPRFTACASAPAMATDSTVKRGSSSSAA